MQLARLLLLASTLFAFAAEAHAPVTVRGHDGTGTTATDLAPLVDARDKTVRETLGAPPKGALVVDVVKDLRAARTLERPWRLPEWAAGAARPNDREIVLMLGGRNGRHDVPRTLTHELAHLAMHDATGGVRVPRWFDEGVARVLAGEHGVIDERALARARIARDRFDLDGLAASFPADAEGAARAYAISARAIRILIDTHGEDVLARIAGRVKDGARFTDAIVEEAGVRPFELSLSVWRSVDLYAAWATVLVDVDLFMPLAGLVFVVGAVSVRRRRRAALERMDDGMPVPIDPLDVVLVRWRVVPLRTRVA